MRGALQVHMCSSLARGLAPVPHVWPHPFSPFPHELTNCSWSIALLRKRLGGNYKFFLLSMLSTYVKLDFFYFIVSNFEQRSTGHGERNEYLTCFFFLHDYTTGQCEGMHTLCVLRSSSKAGFGGTVPRTYGHIRLLNFVSPSSCCALA